MQLILGVTDKEFLSQPDLMLYKVNNTVRAHGRDNHVFN